MKTSLAYIVHALAACLAALLLAPASALAVQEDRTPLNLAGGEDSARQAAETGASGGGYARMIVGLLVVLAVIYGLAWVVKQVKASREGQAGGAGQLAPVSSLPLGPGRSVHLVRVGRELVLLGAAEKGVTPIRTYDEDEARLAGLLPEDEGAEVVLAPSADVTRTAAGVLELLRARTVRR